MSNYPHVVLPDGRIEFAVGDLVSDEERVVCFALTALPVPLAQGAAGLQPRRGTAPSRGRTKLVGGPRGWDSGGENCR